MRVLLSAAAGGRRVGAAAGVGSARRWSCSCGRVPISTSPFPSVHQRLRPLPRPSSSSSSAPSSSRFFSSYSSPSASGPPLSGLRHSLSAASSNRPFLGWLVVGGVLVVAVMLYNSFTRSSEDDELLDAAFDAVLASPVPAALHPEAAAKDVKVRMVKGAQINGYLQPTRADLWYEVRLVCAAAGGAAGAAKAGEGERVLGVYKLRMTAHRDRRPQLEQRAVPPTATKEERTEADGTVKPAAEGKEAKPAEVLTVTAAPAPLWQLDQLVLSSPSRHVSYTWEKDSGAGFRRAPAFIPVTKPSTEQPKAPSTALTTSSPSTPLSSSSSSPSSSASSSPSSSPSFSIFPLQLTWGNVVLMSGGVVLSTLASVALVRRSQRAAVVKGLKEAVERALQQPTGGGGRVARGLGERPRVVRVVQSDIRKALLRAVFEVSGYREGGQVAGSGRVQLQAVKQGVHARGAPPVQQWRVVHSTLTTSDGQQVQLYVLT